MWAILIEGAALFIVAWLISIADHAAISVDRDDDPEETQKEILKEQLMLMTPPFIVEWLCIIFFDISQVIAMLIFVGIYVLEHIIILAAGNIFKG